MFQSCPKLGLALYGNTARAFRVWCCRQLNTFNTKLLKADGIGAWHFT